VGGRGALRRDGGGVHPFVWPGPPAHRDRPVRSSALITTADSSSRRRRSRSMDAHGTIQSYIEASIHLILHQRRVYPSEVFERRRLFDVTVFRSRHVELNDYIALVARGARELLDRGEADALVVSILGEHRDTGSSLGDPEVLERFRLEFRMPPTAGHQGGAASSSSSSPLDVETLQAHLRGFLLKLHVCDSLLPPLPSHTRLTFTCELHTEPTRAAQPLSPQLLEQWVESDTRGRGPGGSAGSSAGGSAGAAAAHLVPLKSLALSDGTTMALNVLTHAQSQAGAS
jgi:mitotic spindle assembly checkpoint protein MAD2B